MIKEMIAIFPLRIPFICCKITAVPAYGIYISQLRFLDKRVLLTNKLLNQGILVVQLNSSFRPFYDHYHALFNVTG
jgi:hypothetical protein